MPANFIEYRSGYKYQLASIYAITITLKPAANIDTKYIKLDVAGNLVIAEGYAWDGPSGPVIDTKENMRASLVHDALYQLMRGKNLNTRDYKDAADRIFESICIADGVPKHIAEAFYLGLKIGGAPAADPKHEKKINRAPK